MASAAREYLMAVEESAYLTPAASPTIWTTATTYGLSNAAAYYARLTDSNSFDMYPNPIMKQIMYGGGVAKPGFTVSDKIECKGTLKIELSVSQAPFWLSWAGVTMNGAQTAPWTSTEPVGDLPSVALYHAIVQDNGTVKRRVYLGCKVTDWTISMSGDNTTVMLTLGITGSTPQGNQFDSSTDPTSGTFPVPLETYFPSDPYLFIHSHGYVTIGGNARTKYDSLSISVKNVLAGKFFSSRFLQMLRFLGRTVDVGMKVIYSTSPDDRTTFEGLTTETASIELSNGTHSVTMNMESTNIYTQLKEDLPLTDVYMFNQTSRPMFDVSAATDFALTFA